MTTSNPSTPGNRRDHLRRDREQAARERRIRTWATFGALGIVLATIAGVLIWVIASTRPTTAPPLGGDHTVGVGSPDAPVTVTVFQDFMCPACGFVEQINRADLDELVDAGVARVELHLMTFKDPSSQGTRYSTRAANALVAVATAAPERMLAFNAALFDHQPQQGTPGLSDTEIAELARELGVSDEVVATFAQLRHEEFVSAANAAGLERIRTTPTVLVNGVEFDPEGLFQAGPLRAAVEAAAG